MRLRTVLLALLIAMLVPGGGRVEAMLARVTYISGSTVYLDAGVDKGLESGNRLVIMRDDEVVAVVEVRDVSSRRSACTIVQQLLEPSVNDVVHLEKPASPIASAEKPDTADIPGVVSSPFDSGTANLTTSKKKKQPRGNSRRGNGIRGRIGVRYLVVRDRTDSTHDLSQPALDLRMDARNLNGGSWGGSIDIRSRRIYRGDQSSDDRTRIYRLNVSRQGVNDPWNFVMGRQFSPALSAVSIFDGVSVDYSRPRWSTGLFSGTQPDAADNGYSDLIREHGFYVQFRGTPGPRNWQLTTGVIGSYEDSEINREFFYLQGRYNGPKLSIYANQEVDYNRGWKADEGQSEVSPTSSFISLRYRLTRAFEVHGGYDNRHNVRLYRDRVTPITEFDDAFRLGLWGGASARLGHHVRFGLDMRTNDGGTAGRSDSYSLTLGASRLTSANIDLRGRATSYANDQTEGQLFSLSAGLQLGRQVRLAIRGGLREDLNLNRTLANNSVNWYGLDLDFSLGRHWYLLLDVERTQGDFEDTDQFYSTLSYRF